MGERSRNEVDDDDDDDDDGDDDSDDNDDDDDVEQHTYGTRRSVMIHRSRAWRLYLPAASHRARARAAHKHHTHAHTKAS